MVTRKQQLILSAVAAGVAPLQGPAVTPDAADLPGDLNGLRAAFRSSLGQPTVPANDWSMSNNRLAARLSQLEQLVAAKFADLSPRLDLANAALAVLQTSDAAQNAQLALLATKENLNESATAANAQAIAALQAQQQLADAQRAELAARATADEATLAGLQQQVTQALFAANTAQSSASQAQAKADADATAAQLAKAAADAAQATASTAQAAYTSLAARFRTVRVGTPAVAIGGTMSIPVTWATPFADANYNAVAEFEGLSLLGLTAVVTNRTAAGCTVSSKNVLGIVLAQGLGTVTITAIHDAPST